MGLLCYRARNFKREGRLCVLATLNLNLVTEAQKFGMDARSMVYIQLANYPSHYLVIVIGDDDLRYALIMVRVAPESEYNQLVMDDIAWLDSRRIHGVTEGEGMIPSREDSWSTWNDR